MTPHEDFLGAGGGVAGAIGGLVRAIQTPQTWRRVLVIVGTAAVFGVAGLFLVRWQYPSLPDEILFVVALAIGFASGEACNLGIKMLAYLSARLELIGKSKIDHTLPIEKGAGYERPADRDPGK